MVKYNQIEGVGEIVKKIVGFLLFSLTIYFAYQYREKIYELYNIYFVPIEDKITKLEKNDYYRNYDYTYLKNTNNFIPHNKNDIKNIYYTIVNSGMKYFTFYCPSDYKTCINDVNDLANDQDTVSNINNFVHPFNSFKTLKTEVDSTGKVQIEIEKVYDEQMIIILNYKVDEIIIDLTEPLNRDNRKIYDEVYNEFNSKILFYKGVNN